MDVFGLEEAVVECRFVEAVVALLRPPHRQCTELGIASVGFAAATDWLQGPGNEPGGGVCLTLLLCEAERLGGRSLVFNG
jgi:hypothetical protein